MIRTRCKFRVVGVEDTEYEIKRTETTETGNTHGLSHRTEYVSYDPPKFAQNVRLAAQYDPNKGEDVSFADATPSGEMKFYLNNPQVIGHFKPGQEYYIDLVPIEK